jgi:uncharacterized protein involved in type VI secretion and phage assembly
VVRAIYGMQDEQLRAVQASDGSAYYQVNLELSPARVPFRPARRTPKPHMQGPQTAVVVGPAGAEIFCDEYSANHHDGKSENRSRARLRRAGAGVHRIPRIGRGDRLLARTDHHRPC